MSATSDTNSGGVGNVLGKVLGTFENVFPSYLDYRFGRDPNAHYTDGQGQAYGFAPQGNVQSDLDKSRQLFGAGSSIPAPVAWGGVAVVTLIALKIFKVI